MVRKAQCRTSDLALLELPDQRPWNTDRRPPAVVLVFLREDLSVLVNQGDEAGACVWDEKLKSRPGFCATLHDQLGECLDPLAGLCADHNRLTEGTALHLQLVAIGDGIGLVEHANKMRYQSNQAENN